MALFLVTLTPTPAAGLSQSHLGGPVPSRDLWFREGLLAAQPVPEPTTVLLLSAGLAGVGAAVRKRRKAHKSEEA
ncbi:MAG: PEP-CTERM sorting domain-containing protein [Pyrinomonadaceae bacterium]